MTNDCVRVLHVFGSLDRGGAESMIMNVYRKIDRDRVQFDFVANESSFSYAYESEIRELGGRIYYLPVLSLKRILSFMRAWKSLLSEHSEWRVVHIHNTSSALVSIPIAKKLGRITIAHSHTAGSDGTLKSKLKIFSRFPIRYLANYLFSCSLTAARWMFGSQAKRAYVLSNAIDVHDFLPDSSKRDEIRMAIGLLPSWKVIGHVGRFIDVKNHVFMLNVLSVMVKQHSMVFLMLIGDGPNKKEIMNLAERLGLANHILFMGIRPDIADLMQGMDAFIFPSLHEGLPVTLVEAQASGLPCLVSDTVSREVKLTNCIEFVSLDTPVSIWASRLLELAAQIVRPDNQRALTDSGYDVEGNANWLQHFYITLMERR